MSHLSCFFFSVIFSLWNGIKAWLNFWKHTKCYLFCFWVTTTLHLPLSFPICINLCLQSHQSLGSPAAFQQIDGVLAWLGIKEWKSLNYKFNVISIFLQWACENKSPKPFSIHSWKYIVLLVQTVTFSTGCGLSFAIFLLNMSVS